MNKIFIILVLNVFLVNNSFAYDVSLLLTDKLFENGNKLCKKGGLGNYLITENPIKLVDISNDGIKDIIIDTSTQRCEKSFSYFAGGTGGNDFIFFINPTVDIISAWNFSEKNSNKKNRIFIKFFRNYKVIEWKYKKVLKIELHGLTCGEKGHIGCYTIQSVLKKVSKQYKDQCLIIKIKSLVKIN